MVFGRHLLQINYRMSLAGGVLDDLAPTGNGVLQHRKTRTRGFCMVLGVFYFQNLSGFLSQNQRGNFPR
jgi:hypothetical protein